MDCINSVGRRLDIDPVVQAEYDYNNYVDCEGDLEEPIPQCLNCPDMLACWIVSDLLKKYMDLKGDI